MLFVSMTSHFPLLSVYTPLNLCSLTIILLTKSIAPGKDVYGEEIIIDKENREEYRVWDPSKSKLCSAMIKGISQIGIKPGFKVLYLGVSTGTTTSHVSDIV